MTVLGSSVAISRSIVAYPTLTGQALRYAVAATILALLARRAGRMDPMDLLRLVALSATGLVGFNVCLLAALRHAEAAVVGTVVGCSPLALAIVGPLSNRTRPAARLVLASAVVVAGAALVEGTGRADRTGLLAAAGTLAGEVLFSLLAAPLLPGSGRSGYPRGRVRLPYPCSGFPRWRLANGRACPRWPRRWGWAISRWC
jgi:drug/metabolite transporter (DMT)-like permease